MGHLESSGLTGSCGISCRHWEESVCSSASTWTWIWIWIWTSSCASSSFCLCPSLYSCLCPRPSLCPGLGPGLWLLLWRTRRTGPPCCDEILGSLWQICVPEDGAEVVQRTLEEGWTESRGLLASGDRRGQRGISAHIDSIKPSVLLFDITWILKCLISLYICGQSIWGPTYRCMRQTVYLFMHSPGVHPLQSNTLGRWWRNSKITLDLLDWKDNQVRGILSSVRENAAVFAFSSLFHLSSSILLISTCNKSTQSNILQYLQANLLTLCEMETETHSDDL